MKDDIKIFFAMIVCYFKQDNCVCTKDYFKNCKSLWKYKNDIVFIQTNKEYPYINKIPTSIKIKKLKITKDYDGYHISITPLGLKSHNWEWQHESIKQEYYKFCQSETRIKKLERILR